MAGCVFGYFADCTVVMPLFLLIAILRNVCVGMLRFRWSSMGAVAGRLALAEKPTFHVSGYQLTKVCQKIRSHFINKQRHPFRPFSSLTLCCALLLHKSCLEVIRIKNVFIFDPYTYKVQCNLQCNDYVSGGPLLTPAWSLM